MVDDEDHDQSYCFSTYQQPSLEESTWRCFKTKAPRKKVTVKKKMPARPTEQWTQNELIPEKEQGCM